MKIIIEFPNGDSLITSPERLQLAPSKDGKNVILVAAGQGIAAFEGQLTPIAKPEAIPAPAAE